MCLFEDKKCNQMKEQYYVDNNYVSSLSEIANLENYKTVPKEEICAFNLKTHVSRFIKLLIND